MKVYISGPITGIENNNEKAFSEKEAEITLAGNDPVNPLKIQTGITDPSWEDYMKADIPELVKCDEVVALPGWEMSRGAIIEIRLALDLRIPVHFPGN